MRSEDVANVYWRARWYMFSTGVKVRRVVASQVVFFVARYLVVI